MPKSHKSRQLIMRASEMLPEELLACGQFGDNLCTRKISNLHFHTSKKRGHSFCSKLKAVRCDTHLFLAANCTIKIAAIKDYTEVDLLLSTRQDLFQPFPVVNLRNFMWTYGNQNYWITFGQRRPAEPFNNSTKG